MVISSALNTDLPRNVYVLWKPFIMPSDKGGMLAISVEDSIGAYFLSMYTIILGSMFGFFWQFITYLIITCYPTENDSRVWSRKDRKDFIKDGTAGSKPLLPDELLEVRRSKANRYIALVSVWNTTDPASAMLLLMEHAWIMCKTVGDQATGMLDVIVLLLTVGFMISAGAARVLIASTLFIGNESPMGNVAPINASSVFFWGLSDASDAIRSFTFGTSSAKRASGAIESISDDTRNKVVFHKNEQSISYNYTITGVEFGLQHASELYFPVRGECTLQYDYIDATIRTDTYFPPILKNNITVSVVRGITAPVAFSDYSKYNAETIAANGTSSFVIVFQTASQQSFYPGTDPMYETEDLLPLEGAPGYQIKQGRPWLDCWEQSYWAYKDIKAHNPRNLSGIPDSVLPGFLREELVPAYFSQVRYPLLVRSLGGAVLFSSSSSFGGVIDASLANWHKDMERLVLINYVSSRNAFRDSASLTDLLNANPPILENFARENGVPKRGLDEIVVGTSKVTTMSITVLIVIPAAWLLVWCIITVFRCNRCTSRNSGKASRFTLRAVGLQATQMYRLLDEEVCGDRDDWEGRKTHMPYIRRAKGPKHPKHMASPADLDTTTGPPSPKLNPTTPLFAAPKVVRDGSDDRYHLKFSGPVAYEAKAVDHPWTWDSVAGEPSKDDIPGVNQTFNGKGIKR